MFKLLLWYYDEGDYNMNRVHLVHQEYKTLVTFLSLTHLLQTKTTTQRMNVAEQIVYRDSELINEWQNKERVDHWVL